MLTLRRETLSQLPSGLVRPAFDPARVTTGIVHLGLGGFHRAHMARYCHNLMNRDASALAWGIAGAGLLPADRRMMEALAPQDNLYTLVERDAAGATATAIGALSAVIFAGEDSSALLEAADGEGVRVISLTVTEHGYCLNRATKVLDPAHPLIQQDLETPERPASAIGVIVEALRRRREAKRPAPTLLSCDNIQHNGQVLRAAVLALAGLRDAALARWIEAECAFPSTMVDRITPVTTPADIAWLRDTYQVEDRWPVFAETFTQWVIEDHFPQGRPAWQTVGAQFVPDVAPYEFMKLRLLNGSHLAVAGLGRLMGLTTIDETLGEPLMRRYMAALMDRETGPTVPPVPGIDLDDYNATLLERFANPAIKDTVERVNTDAPINVLMDPIRSRLAAGESLELLALALAAWIRRIRGVDEQGAPIEVKHPLAAELQARAESGGANPRPVLSMEGLFGAAGQDDRLVSVVGRWLTRLYEEGAAATVRGAAADLAF